MDDAEAEWQSWLSGLAPSKQAAAEWLRTQFEALGAANAPDWARSEIEEDQPQLARFVLLRALWRGAIDGWADPGALEQIAVARRLLDAGADRDDLELLARAVAYEAVFATVDELDRGADANVSGGHAGWVVVESGEDGAPTGRRLSGLHEDLLTMDPSGRDGADLWR
ncbi:MULTISPECIES: hypothetical protein [Streptomyces]|uniref:hypothetical protein n=1 Tax=Streptomyces TaxID=1883 RepID=UPI00278BD9F4|nr:hypothetical protein [Streptomyces hydrogenans]